MGYLGLVSDRRQLDIQALLEAGIFTPNAGPLSETQQDQIGINDFGLDDFSRETGVEAADLTRFFQGMQSELESDPQLLEQLNQIRQQLGLPPINSASEAGLQDPSNMLPEDLAALLVMWALQQENKNRTGGGGSGHNRGNLPQQNYSNVRPANTNRGGGGGGTSGGGGSSGGGGGVSHSGHSHGGGGSSSATGGGSSAPTAVPGGPVPDLPANIGPVTPGENGVPAGLKPNAARGAALVREVFGFDGTIGGVGQRSGPSDHPHGNAIDVMTNQNMEQGQQIADFFVKHAQELGVKYVIFNQRIASENNGWQWTAMEDRGSPTANHMDHPHISFHGPE